MVGFCLNVRFDGILIAGEAEVVEVPPPLRHKMKIIPRANVAKRVKN